jgi:hypothetical protein
MVSVSSMGIHTKPEPISVEENERSAFGAVSSDAKFKPISVEEKCQVEGLAFGAL